ncbi:Uronate isomerase [hydrothermal vent metagenome]|uniref:Uronate isomerase n=1 Tax=hydrothermal vent metagenome TaxID=652676 RepID=A0A3B0TCP2_9ZZZZ
MPPKPLRLHPDRMFCSDPEQRRIARALFERVENLPVISPHGHCEPSWFAQDTPFPDPAELLIVPDHYVTRMLYSQGIGLERLGVWRADGTRPDIDPRDIWQVFADHWHLFLGTPTRVWLEHVFADVCELDEALCSGNAGAIYDHIEAKLRTPEFTPRALYKRFNIEALSTTDFATGSLAHHQALAAGDWPARIVPTFRPDDVTDPGNPEFAANIARLGEITGEDTATYAGYLKALAARRAAFKALGATATDHGVETARTADLSPANASSLYDAALKGSATLEEADDFRAQMLTEMARMSLDDGLVMQLHVGAVRNHNAALYKTYGPNIGADIPRATDYVNALRPLLDVAGNAPGFRLILFTLDEATYSRELAPLAGHYPSVVLGPPWWFHDSPEAMLRFRCTTTETAGVFNTAGFNDDTRAFLSLGARHDLARRIDCRYLAQLVAEHRLELDDAHMLAGEMAYGLAKRAYNL